MKIENLLSEHKKGVRAIKYNKKPMPHIEPKKPIKYTVKKKQEPSLDEGNTVKMDTPKPRNFVAKNAKTAGAGAHKDKKKAEKQGNIKHKAKAIPVDESSDDVSDAKHRLAHLEKIFDPSYEYSDDHSEWKKHNEIRQEMDRLKKIIKQGVMESERRMSRAAKGNEKYGKDGMRELAKAGREGASEKKLDAIRDKHDKYDEGVSEGMEYSKRTKLIRYLAKKLDIELNYLELASDDELVDLYKQSKNNMSEGSVQDKLYKKHQELRKKSGLPDPEHYKKLGQQKQKEIDDMKKSSIKEVEMGKIVDYKPGQTATLNTGPGMTTILDLKKNPTSLTKDPATGKLKLMGPQAQGTSGATATQASTIKPGDSVEIGKVESLSNILRLSGLK